MSAARIVARLLEDDVEDFMKRRLDEIRYPTKEEVTYEAHADEEHDTYMGHFQSDEPELDRQTERWIAAELRAGNQWAWCSVDVVAKWVDHDGTEFEGHDYLGCCCYRSKEDFCTPDGYYPQMKDDAYDDLIARIREARSKPGGQ